MLAEAQARLNSEINQLQLLFENHKETKQLKSLTSASIDPLEQLNMFNEQRLTLEYLQYAEALGRVNPYIDNENLLNLLYNCWNLFHDGLAIERKLALKRIKALKEDKKRDPDVLLRQESNLKVIEDKKVNALICTLRLKAMLSKPYGSFAES